MARFKAFIRVVKSLNKVESVFDSVEVIREPIIEASDKAEVKKILLEMYPQFFQSGKVYEKETKDIAQFFYVVIFPLYEWENDLINQGAWSCSSCGHIHENKYVSKPRLNSRLFGEDIMFCRSDDDHCMNEYKKFKFAGIELQDNYNYITTESPNYIYKCTEKSTGKSYIGKTRNAPFFRWWNHLTHSNSPFGLYLRSTKLSEWTFEVLEILPPETNDTDVFRIESDYILKFNSINNGYNSVISNKNAAILESEPIENKL